MSSSVYVSKIVKEGDDLVMLMQPDLLAELKFKENEIYSWEPREDGSIIINKIAKSNIEG